MPITLKEVDIKIMKLRTARDEALKDLAVEQVLMDQHLNDVWWLPTMNEPFWALKDQVQALQNLLAKAYKERQDLHIEGLHE